MPSIGILTNQSSISAARNLAISSRELGKSTGKLSSGLRIQSASDDAAGMAVATGFRAITRSQVQAQRNANDGVAMLQTAESAYGSVADILIRMRELSVQAANDTLTDTDRSFLDTEYQQLITEVDRIAAVTEYNGILVLDGTAGDGAGLTTFQIGVRNNAGNDQLEVQLDAMDSTLVKINGTDIAVLANAQGAIDSIDSGLEQLSTRRSTLGAAINQLTLAADSLGVAHENLSGALGQIRDVDITTESARFAGQNVLMQSGVAMLAQANQQPNLALNLLS